MLEYLPHVGCLGAAAGGADHGHLAAALHGADHGDVVFLGFRIGTTLDGEEGEFPAVDIDRYIGMFLVLVAGGELDDVALGLARAVRDEDADFTTVVRIVLALRLGRQRADETGPSLVAVHTEGFPVLFAQHPLRLGRLRGQTRQHDHCGGHTSDKDDARPFHGPTKFLSALTFLSCIHERVS